MIEFNIFSNKISEYVKEIEKKGMKFMNKKRERTNDKTSDDDSPLDICCSSKVEFKLFGKNSENNVSKNLKDDYIYVGCEDGNIKLIKTKNESIFNIFFK